MGQLDLFQVFRIILNYIDPEILVALAREYTGHILSRRERLHSANIKYFAHEITSRFTDMDK